VPNRIIKESICTSDTIEGLSWFEEVFFYRLIVNCDDYGRFDGRPAIIKSRLFPLKSVTDKIVVDTLNKLSEVGLVHAYEYNEKPILQLVTWDNHQNVRNKKSKYPAINGDFKLSATENIKLIASDINCNQMNSNVPVIQSNPIQSESNPNPNPNTKAVAEFFDELWSLYPKKEGKGRVSDTQKRKLYAIGKDKMEIAIERYKKKLKAEGTEPRYIQQGSTFFNSGYVDYLDDNYKPVEEQGSLDLDEIEELIRKGEFS
jgi:hypothetical protein